MSRSPRWLPAATLALVLSAGPTGAATGLTATMAAAGLEAVELLDTAPPLARGRLAAGGELVVVLFAGCGAAAAAGREAALAAVADLGRTPRRHAVELVLCAGGGDRSEAAAAWLALRPVAERDRLLAALLFEPAPAARPATDQGTGEALRPVGLMLPAQAAGGRRLPPGWLAHAAVAGARSGGSDLRMGSWRRPLPAQLLGRYGRPRASSGSVPLLAAGLPALGLTGAAAAGWPAVLAAIVRRLDGLEGRPRRDDAYLALAGRVWSRRDLYWLGLALWVGQLLAGLPGTWRGTAGGLRRQRGRWYLPGFVFRMLFLVVLLTAPVGTLLLLAPAALATLLPVRRPAAVVAVRMLALAPPLVFAACLAAAAAAGRAAPWPAQPLRSTLILIGLALALSLIGRRRPGPESPAR